MYFPFYRFTSGESSVEQISLFRVVSDSQVHQGMNCCFNSSSIEADCRVARLSWTSADENSFRSWETLDSPSFVPTSLTAKDSKPYQTFHRLKKKSL